MTKAVTRRNFAKPPNAARPVRDDGARANGIGVRSAADARLAPYLRVGVRRSEIGAIRVDAGAIHVDGGRS